MKNFNTTNPPISQFETPLTTKDKPVVSDEPPNWDRTKGYQKAIGSIMYLMLGTQPDLTYAVGLLARFSSNPSNDHLDQLFRLLGYIKKTRNRYLYFGNANPEEEPEGYTV